MAKAEKEPLPPCQRILPGFQKCFTGQDPDGRITHLSNDILGIPADLIAHQELKEREVEARVEIKGEIRKEIAVLPPEPKVREFDYAPVKVKERKGMVPLVTLEISPEPPKPEPIPWKVGASGRILAKRGPGRWRKEPVLTREVPRHVAREIIPSEEIPLALDQKALEIGRIHWSCVISPDFDPLHNAQKGYADDISAKIKALEQMNSGALIDSQEKWQIGGACYPAASFLAKFGVIAFLMGREGAEQLFEIRKRNQIIAKDEISVEQARQLLAHFTGDGGIRINNFAFQYAFAKTLLLSRYLKPEE